jgi:hypothetical protein
VCGGEGRDMGGGVVGVKRVRGRGVRGGCVCVWGG